MSFFILPYLSLFGREFFCVTVILVGHIIFLKEHFTFPLKNVLVNKIVQLSIGDGKKS